MVNEEEEKKKKPKYVRENETHIILCDFQI